MAGASRLLAVFWSSRRVSAQRTKKSAAKVQQKKRAAKICYSFATDATRLLLVCYWRVTRCSIF